MPFLFSSTVSKVRNYMHIFCSPFTVVLHKQF